MTEEFELNHKLCFLDKTPFADIDNELMDELAVYNHKVKRAVKALDEQLPTFAVVDNGIQENEKLCLLIERGSFWGMGYLPTSVSITSSDELKDYLNPYTDNDYIRNSIYSFVEANPDKKFIL